MRVDYEMFHPAETNAAIAFFQKIDKLTYYNNPGSCLVEMTRTEPVGNINVTTVVSVVNLKAGQFLRVKE